MKTEEMQWRMGMRGSMEAGVEEEEWNDGEIGWGDKKKMLPFPFLHCSAAAVAVSAQSPSSSVRNKYMHANKPVPTSLRIIQATDPFIYLPRRVRFFSTVASVCISLHST